MVTSECSKSTSNRVAASSSSGAWIGVEDLGAVVARGTSIAA